MGFDNLCSSLLAIISCGSNFKFMRTNRKKRVIGRIWVVFLMLNFHVIVDFFYPGSSGWNVILRLNCYRPVMIHLYKFLRDLWGINVACPLCFGLIIIMPFLV